MRFELTRLYMRQRRRDAAEEQLHMTAEDVDDADARAFIGHMQQLDIGGARQHFAGHVSGCAGAVGSIRELAGPGTRKLNEFV